MQHTGRDALLPLPGASQFHLNNTRDESKHAHNRDIVALDLKSASILLMRRPRTEFVSTPITVGLIFPKCTAESRGTTGYTK